MFGDWLKQRRKTLDLTQAELARRAACSPVTIEKIEAGQRRPSKQLIDLLAAALNIDPAERESFALAARAGRAPAPSAPATTPPRQRRILNLSAPPTRLIGREADLAAAEQILTGESERLLTLTGPPGIGKTRLATQLAARLLPGLAEGGCFVELAPVEDAAWVPDAIARALRLPPVDARPAPNKSSTPCATGPRCWCLTTSNMCFPQPSLWPACWVNARPCLFWSPAANPCGCAPSASCPFHPWQ